MSRRMLLGHKIVVALALLLLAVSAVSDNLFSTMFAAFSVGWSSSTLFRAPSFGGKET